MNPVFTLNYPELLVSTHLQRLFPKSKDYCVLIPLSAQQKGFDLVLQKRNGNGSKVVTFQIKSSRTYQGEPGIAPRSKMRTFSHYMWLNKFAVPPEADFFILLGLYAPTPTTRKNSVALLKPHMLLFTHAEMRNLIASIRQRTTTNPDRHFGFGFDQSSEAFLTRGHAQDQHPDYSSYLLSERLPLIRQSLY